MDGQASCLRSGFPALDEITRRLAINVLCGKERETLGLRDFMDYYNAGMNGFDHRFWFTPEAGPAPFVKAHMAGAERMRDLTVESSVLSSIGSAAAGGTYHFSDLIVSDDGSVVQSDRRSS